MIEAVLFDMDGVLVDSEEYICKAAIQMYKNLGYTVYEEDFLPFVGKGENKYIGGVAEKYKISINIDEAKNNTYRIYGEMVHGKLSLLPGVREFIKAAKLKGLKLAVATSADKIKMEINLRETGLGIETFDATANGLEVEHKKPAPDIFLLAAKKLGVHPNNALVVEDAISGIDAALAAGCRCLALTTSFPANKLTKANWICKDLSEYPTDCLNW